MNKNVIWLALVLLILSLLGADITGIVGLLIALLILAGALRWLATSKPPKNLFRNIIGVAFLPLVIYASLLILVDTLAVLNPTQAVLCLVFTGLAIWYGPRLFR